MNMGMNIDEAVKCACEEPDLASALTWICVWESERVVKQAHEYLNTGVSTAAPGQGWDTLFGICIRRVMEAWKPKRRSFSDDYL